MVSDKTVLSYRKNTANIKIYGNTKNRRKTIRKATQWMISYVMGDRLANNVSVDISFFSDMKLSSHGEMWWIDTNSRPRYFEIVLNRNLSDRQLLKTLAHEVIHVNQYVTGDLKDFVCVKSQHSKWKKRYIKTDGVGRIPYRQLPWEIEAFRDQNALFTRWKDNFGIKFDRKGMIKYT